MSEKAVVVRAPVEVVSFEGLSQQVRRLDEFYKSLMQEGTDYGVIPGTKKPTLLKSGAELLRLWAGLETRFEINDTGTDFLIGLFNYEIKCSLSRQGELIAEGVGSCNSLEGKYRYRWLWASELPQGFDKGKATKREVSLKSGSKSPQYRVENENPQDLANTILKMAKKRAFIDAILTATGASRIFTQDIEDMEALSKEVVVEAKVEAPTEEAKVEPAKEEPTKEEPQPTKEEEKRYMDERKEAGADSKPSYGREGAEPLPTDDEVEAGLTPLPELVEGIDIDWIKESCIALKWQEVTIKSYLATKFQVSKEGSIEEVIARLSREQQEEFVREIHARLELL